MSRFPAVLACVFAVGSGPALAMAQSAPDSSAGAPSASSSSSAASSAPAPAPSASADKPAATVAAPSPTPRVSISSEAAAMLDAGRPAYNPPKPVVQKPDDEYPDLRDFDKPKNGIIRLPKYVVHSQKNPIFRNQDLYTKDQLANLAMQRYAGLNFGPFSDLNKPIALQMYGDDVRRQNLSDLSDAAATAARGGDAAEGEYIKRVSQDTYARTFDIGGPLPMQSSSR